MASQLGCCSEGRVLTVVEMQKPVLSRILIIDIAEGLLCVEEGVVGEEVDGFGVVELQFFLDDHDEFEDGEGLEYEDP